MISPLVRSVMCALGAFLIGTSVLWAETLVEEVPPAFEESVEEWVSETEIQTSPFYRQRFKDTYAEQIKSGQIYTVASEMVSLFDARDWGENESKQQKIMDQLQKFLAALKVALLTPGIEGPLDTKIEQNIFITALNQQKYGLTSLRMETMRDARGEDVSGYFKDTLNEFLLYEWTEDGEKVRLLLTSGQVRQWRLLEDSLTNLITKQVAQISQANVQALKDAAKRWENYLDKGYSQMPWESQINGWLIESPGFPELGPPDHQWVVMHPTLGLELSVDPFDKTRVQEAMHLEVLGHIWYQGKKLEDYWGVSATVSLREDLDPGIGVLVHIKRHWNLGVTWHDVSDDPFLFFSVDLFNFAKQQAPAYLEKYKGLREQLGLE